MENQYEIDLPCLVDVWDTREDGEEYLVKSGVVIKRRVDLRYILPEQTATPKGGVFRNKCRVYDTIRKADHMVNMSFKQINQLIDEVVYGDIKPIGFK